MTVERRGTLRYAAWSLSIALVFGIVLFPLALARGAGFVGWGLGGWLIATVLGTAAGSWLEATHGTPGAAFLKVFGACMLARLLAYGAGAALALVQGQAPFLAFLAGLGAGYVPTQLFEGIWFARKTR